MCDRADVVASYVDGPLGLVALSASRAQAAGTINASLSHSPMTGLDLFSTVSKQTRREAVSTNRVAVFRERNR